MDRSLSLYQQMHQGGFPTRVVVLAIGIQARRNYGCYTRSVGNRPPIVQVIDSSPCGA